MVQQQRQSVLLVSLVLLVVITSSTCNAKRIEGVITSTQDFMYLSKFCFQEGTVNVTRHVAYRRRHRCHRHRRRRYMYSSVGWCNAGHVGKTNTMISSHAMW
jgi:hypothetical protein